MKGPRGVETADSFGLTITRSRLKGPSPAGSIVSRSTRAISRLPVQAHRQSASRGPSAMGERVFRRRPEIPQVAQAPERPAAIRGHRQVCPTPGSRLSERGGMIGHRSGDTARGTARPLAALGDPRRARSPKVGPAAVIRWNNCAAVGPFQRQSRLSRQLLPLDHLSGSQASFVRTRSVSSDGVSGRPALR